MASFLSKQGYHIHLYEKSDRLGGKIGTESIETGLVERGPNAIYATAGIMQWLEDLGLKPIRGRRKLKRWIWQGKLSTPRPLALLGRIARKLHRKSPPILPSTTVAEFFSPLIGEADVRNLLSPALQGIYGTTAEQLTVLSLWPQLQQEKTPSYWKVIRLLKGPKAHSVSFVSGMQEFIDALSDSVRGNIHLNYQGPFVLQPNTIVCTEAFQAADLLEKHWAEGAALLREIPYTAIASVTYHCAEALPWTQQGFGVLFPRHHQIRSLGCLFNHSIFPGRIFGTTQTSLTFILNETDSPDTMSAQDLQALNWHKEPRATQVWRYPKGLPVYNEARWSAIERLHQSTTRPHEVILFGNYVAGISIRDMIQTVSSFATPQGSADSL